MNYKNYFIVLINILIIFSFTVHAHFEVKSKIHSKQLNFSQLERPHLTAFVDANYIFLSWSAIKGAKGYNIYRSYGGNQFQKINSNPLAWPTDETTACNKYNSYLPDKDFELERHHIKKTILSKLYPSGVRWTNQCPPFTDHNAEAEILNLSKIYPQIGLIIGQAYSDNNVTVGTIYSYKVKWLDDDNNETEFGNEVSVQAGAVKQLSKPTGLEAEAGDSRVLLIWNVPPSADNIYGYNIFKSTSQTGPFVRCDSIPAGAKISVNLNGDSLDFQHFGFYDNYVSNYTTYFYKVAPRNFLGKLGPMSDVVSAMAKDLTQPMMPMNFSATPLSKDTMLISWIPVKQDIKYRNEMVKGYWVFKYEDFNSAAEDTGVSSKYLLKFVDEKPGLISIFSQENTVRSLLDMELVTEQVYWYRIVCEDTAGNFSYKTSAISAILPDIEPPDTVTNLRAKGSDDYIHIIWDKPDETKKINEDLAGYLIYRGICGDSTVRNLRGDYRQPYPLHLIADIDNKNTLNYKDYSVPKGSPICYRYAVKSYDKSQNLSAMSDSVCERLKDQTPPDPPIVTALQARNKSIKIECVAPPIQDLKGFIVERSENGKSGWEQVYSDSIPKSVSCGSIPFSADSVLAKKINQLSFIDKNIEAEKIYWYRVFAFDYNGNKSKSSPSYSTFTYEIKDLVKPVNLKASLNKGLVSLNWEPEASKYHKTFEGFIVLRSINENLGYRQISEPLNKSAFVDDKTAMGVKYWYKVLALDSNGDISLTSDPISITIK